MISIVESLKILPMPMIQKSLKAVLIIVVILLFGRLMMRLLQRYVESQQSLYRVRKLANIITVLMCFVAL